VADGSPFADTGSVRLPTVLLFFATLFAAVMAYGTRPSWAQYEHGFDFILLARRLQWPLVVLSLGLCLGVFALVVSGKRRAWWLVGLGPVLALFVHRCATDPSNRFVPVEDPKFVAADEAKFIGDADWVVGLQFGDTHYAYPYGVLFDTPVVIHAEHDQRLAVMWSAYANRALAVRIGRDLRATDLEVVSTPANAMLLYNTRIGQFINVVTGQTPKGDRPDQFRDEVAVTKTTWGAWRSRHPEAKVLTPVSADYTEAPRSPIRPTYPMPRKPGEPALAQPLSVAVIHTKQPVALRGEQITLAPLNLTAHETPLLVFRDPATGEIRAFERRIDDLRPRFHANTDKARKKAAFVDADTTAGWDLGGRVVDGPPGMRGKRLTPVAVEDGLYWEVLKHWEPSMQLIRGVP
jgi:hypothetical protein